MPNIIFSSIWAETSRFAQYFVLTWVQRQCHNMIYKRVYNFIKQFIFLLWIADMWTNVGVFAYERLKSDVLTGTELGADQSFEMRRPPPRMGSSPVLLAGSRGHGVSRQQQHGKEAGRKMRVRFRSVAQLNNSHSRHCMDGTALGRAPVQ